MALNLTKLKKTAIFQAIKLERAPLVRWGIFFQKLFSVLGFVLLSGRIGLLFYQPVFIKNSWYGLNNLLAGWVVLFLCLSILLWYQNKFFQTKMKNPELEYSLNDLTSRPGYLNPLSFLDFEAAKVCYKVLRFCQGQKVKAIPGFILLHFIVQQNGLIWQFILGRTLLDQQDLKQTIKREFLGWKKEQTKCSDEFEDIILRAGKIAKVANRQRIGVGDILISLAERESVFKKFLMADNFKAKDIKNLVVWQRRKQNALTKVKKFWTRENLKKRGSIARDWSAGYTINLDKYAIDLREKVKKEGIQEIVGHISSTKAVERALDKKEINNVLLVGEPGTGRMSIVRAIAQRAFLAKSRESINYKRILEFDLTLLEEKEIEKCLQEVVQSGNVILIIKNFEQVLEKMSHILSRFLALSSFQIVAVTSYTGLHKVIERNEAILNLFEKVEVKEISKNNTLVFLENFVPFFEKKHRKFISYPALREIVELSGRYLKDTPFPHSALRLLDESMAFLATYSRNKILLPEHISQVVSEKSEVPIGELAQKEKQTLLNLEELVHKQIVNQEEAVSEVCSALRRARAEIKTRQGPIGTFLFLGPTGVGKTETSKVVANIYFGKKEKMIRLDMSEFQNLEDIKRLIGSNESNGLLTTPVRENPFALVLLDELEKAHPNILNLFLQVLDEGWITDGFGRRVDFSNTIIIATSNAGAEIIRQDIRENKTLDLVKEDLLDYLLRQGAFRPEFINRFDAVVIFKPLTEEHLLLIARLLLGQLSDNLKDKGIKFKITPELLQKIVELSYNPVFGAREMKRVIQDKVENIFAEAILSGAIKRNQSVEIDVSQEDFKLISGGS